MLNNSHKQKINKLKETISSGTPEATLLALARFGNAPRQSPSFSDFETVASLINLAEARIIFPWFWKHNDVLRFRDQFISQIDQSRLCQIIADTSVIIDIATSHWIERVNLFHLFGVSRLFEKVDEEILRLQEKSFSQIRSGLIGVSATNANLLAKGADAKDAIMVIEKLSAEHLKRTFAEYQIYYYEGLDNLIKVLSSYIGTPKEVLIPATVNSIISSYHLTDEHYNLFMEALVTKLPQPARVLVEKC